MSSFRGSHKLKRLEDLRGEGQDDVVVVFLDRLFQYAAVVLIRKTFGGGDVLAEGVVADKELVFGDVGNHAVGPVQHTGFHEMDVPLADVDDVPGLDHFDGQPVVSNWASMKRLPMVDVMIFSGLQRSTSWHRAPAWSFSVWFTTM